ncbi:MAG: DNA topoisomerase IV, partial [Sulfurimonas sp.]|nr:DNA topoisomerase IV [Sulfurimonas sp.]
MKILLLNDNPVVNKLVTLSAQKTSDNLEVVSSIDSVASSVYDLIVIDDTLYTDDLLDEIKTKITFTKSLYICARGAEKVDAFTNILSKPFLPTELVEIFATLGKESQKITLDTVEESTPEAELEEFEELDELDDLEELADIDEDLSDSILDDEEAQKVKDLLNETDEEEELDLDDLDLGEDDLELDEELSLDLEEEPKEAPAQEEEELDIEAQIENAVDELSEEE